MSKTLSIEDCARQLALLLEERMNTKQADHLGRHCAADSALGGWTSKLPEVMARRTRCLFVTLIGLATAVLGALIRPPIRRKQ